MWVTLCIACVAPAEGLRTVAYKDPVGIPTICFGETKNVRLGDKSTVEQCTDRLGLRIEEFGQGVDRCVTVYMPPNRKAALTSTAYNIGLPAFCGSTIVRKLNAGDTIGGCNELLRWNKATYAGFRIVLPGLTKRRETERQMCLEGTS